MEILGPRIRDIAEGLTAVTEAIIFFLGLKLGWWVMGSEAKLLREEVAYWRARSNGGSRSGGGQ